MTMRRARAGARSRPVTLAPPAVAGLLTGGMLVIEVVLLPFWRAMPPPEFHRWFATHAGRIRAVMIPLGVGAGLANGASTFALVAGRRSGRSASALATAATAGVLAITAVVNEPANSRFAGGGLTDDETRDLLSSWARWHHARVALGLTATVAATAALRDRSA